MLLNCLTWHFAIQFRPKQWLIILSPMKPSITKQTYLLLSYNCFERKTFTTKVWQLQENQYSRLSETMYIFDQYRHSFLKTWTLNDRGRSLQLSLWMGRSCVWRCGMFIPHVLLPFTAKFYYRMTIRCMVVWHTDCLLWRTMQELVYSKMCIIPLNIW